MTSKVKLIESVVPWARAMVLMRARACTIAEQLDMSKSDARRMWLEEHGKSSPSGLQPSDLSWYLKTPERRFQGAILLQIAHLSAQSLPLKVSFTHAYYHFARLTAGEYKMGSQGDDPAFRPTERDYTIPYSRGFYLYQIYSDDKLNSGQRKCSLIIRSCRVCKSKYLSSVDEANSKCPSCS